MDYIHYNRGMSKRRPDAPAIERIAERLLSWYGEHARQLPWRQTRDPYAIWVAEVMLQQTRVEAVLPYYQAFMRRFPTPEALAAAPLDAVLRVWEGMGYYARARNLHRAAQLLVEQHSGRLPSDRQQLTELPGVGDYTAAALRSIAFGADELALEGNLRRVLARVFEVRLDPRSPTGVRELRRLGESILPAGRSSDFNQALMDLGATVCTPRSPRCEHCPLRDDCQAYRNGVQDQLPLRAPRRQLPLRQAVAAIWELDGTVLIRRQPPDGLLGGLWAFPGGFLEQAEPPVDGLRRTLAAQHGIKLTGHTALPSLEHSFTHFRLRLHPFRCQATIDPGGNSRGRTSWAVLETDDLQWVELQQLDQYPMGKLDRQLAAEL